MDIDIGNGQKVSLDLAIKHIRRYIQIYQEDIQNPVLDNVFIFDNIIEYYKKKESDEH